MDIDSPVQTLIWIESISGNPDGLWVAPTTNTDTAIPDFNNMVMDPAIEVLSSNQNNLDDEEPKYCRQAISEYTTDLWHSIIEADMNTLHSNHD
jgi:hypothetical protein